MLPIVKARVSAVAAENPGGAHVAWMKPILPEREPEWSHAAETDLPLVGESIRGALLEEQREHRGVPSLRR